ncbi:MAG: NAD-dependent epimerase [Proteobacteria bacterium]|uniref:NAD-dependent epimerase n=1 Tax=Aquabacterium sp. TaxID=1872578 RepID=UPI0035C76CEF|nr:NAD-dependent epimerase [Pseudomonadota bacterium]
MRKILVTGAAGFIGMHVSQALLARGDHVVGLDNLNAYYDPQLKRDRIAALGALPQAAAFRFVEADLVDMAALDALFAAEHFDGVVHLAAQAGVRYSLTHPHAYSQSNLVGFVNMLEACRHHGVAHLVYASSSSVYGGNTRMPFSENDAVDHPVSLYAATKKANELMAHTYSHLYGLPTTGLRFFTVYGPWGRPDMAPMLFTRAILAGEPIKVFNHGKMQRDFTFIDDIVAGVVATLDRPPVADPSFDKAAPQASGSWAPYKVFNIGHSEPVQLMDFIRTLESALGVQAQLDLQPMAPGDVPATYADVSALQAWTGVAPHTGLQEGIGRFVAWYRHYHRV